jgi:2-polyprenyl-3-methyl-5-hydroxy-6-metoxy-1,4-benzoquinol methylase
VKEMDKRKVARNLAKRAVAEGRPLDWFEELYVKSEKEGAEIPWADLMPNPNVVDFIEKHKILGNGKSALKIGTGFGDDAEYLSNLRFEVLAFDISPTAIRKCEERFPDSKVNYVVKDLFGAPAEWQGIFDFVLESYTLQVLPYHLRREAIRVISSFNTSGGDLLVVTRGREEDADEGQMPWPLAESEVRGFEDYGLKCISFEDYADNENPPVRRFRVHYKKL